MASFEEGLGRVMYVAGALEYERPFLGPLYKFMSPHPRDSVRAVPPQVSFFLRHLAEQVSQCWHHDCSGLLSEAVRRSVGAASALTKGTFAVTEDVGSSSTTDTCPNSDPPH